MMIPLSIEILGYAMLQTIQALFFFLVSFFTADTNNNPQTNKIVIKEYFFTVLKEYFFSVFDVFFLEKVFSDL